MDNHEGSGVTGWRAKYKVHPAADVFPMIEGEPLAELVEDIKKNGLKTPITVDKHGVLLDGRSRLQALELAGMKLPESNVQIYYGDHPVEWIISANVHRRHLTKQQKADAIVAALKLAEPTNDNSEKLVQVEPVSKGGHGKVNETKAKALSVGEAHGISESTIKRSLAKAAGKEGSRKEPTGDLILRSILFPCSNFATMTAAKLVELDSQLKEIDNIISRAGSLLRSREHADSLGKIKSAAVQTE
jgi:hypothetical protein